MSGNEGEAGLINPGGAHGHGDDHKPVTVTVIYNGLPKEISVSLQETVQALLSQSLHAFGPLPNQHTLALWTDSGVELRDLNQHLKDAGIKSGTKLLLRPSEVRGGRA